MPEARYHGTVGGYTNHRCRCARCREAMRASKLAYMDRSPEQREAHRLRLLARRGRPLAARTRAFAPRSDRGQARLGKDMR